MPLSGIGNVEFHEMRMKIRCPLVIKVQIHSARSMTYTDARFNPEFILRQDKFFHIKSLDPVAGQRPPDAQLVFGGVHIKRSNSILLFEIDRGSSITCDKHPAL